MPKKPTQKPKKLNVVAVRLDDDQLARIRAAAEKQKRPIANLLAFIVSEWLEKQDQSPGPTG